MSANRKRRLDAIGFVWDCYEGPWEKAIAALKKFKARKVTALRQTHTATESGSNLDIG